jgi:hypothetical protein
MRGRTAVTAGLGALLFAGVAFGASFSNSSGVFPPDSVGGVNVGAAPVSQIAVSGEPLISKVTVTLYGFGHSEPDDADVLLVGPAGQKVVLMSDSGADNSVGGIDITFDDDAGVPVPDEGVLSSGSFMPTNNGPSTLIPACAGEPATDLFPGAPAGPIGADLASAFNGTDPNGTWSLYVVDDCPGFTGALQGGWSVNINPQTSAVVVARFAATARPGQIRVSWKTGEETSLLGFNLFRSGGGRTAKLNSGLIAARHAGTSRGGAYRFADAHARPGVSYTYRLQLVRFDGTKTFAGAVATRAR